MGNDMIDKAKPGPTFDGESMRAILAGRKTQTRRILKGEQIEFAATGGGISPDYRIGTVYYARESPERFDGGVIYRTGDPITIGNKLRVWPWKCRVLAPHCMPRWAARVWLRITDVRVHRLHETSVDDAVAEGVSMEFALLWPHRWEQVNGKGSWERDRNRWVAAYTFEVVKPES